MKLDKINRLVNFSMEDKGYDWYDWFMIVVVLVSLVPLTMHEENDMSMCIDYATTAIFIVDYVLRWSVAGYDSKYHGWKAYALYPFRVSAIIDLLSILPVLLYLAPSLKLLRTWRIVRLLRVGRLFRYYGPLQITIEVLRKKANVLFTVACFAVFYILITALIMFNIEYENSGETHFFDTYWDAIYWATCTLTTVGYGDIYPISALGRAISMMSAIVGIAIIALPSGILTAGYMDAVAEEKRNKELEEYKKRIIRSFPLLENKSLKLWIAKNLPNTEGEWYQGVKFKHIANNVSLAKLQLKGLDMKDVFEVCEKYPEFRIKNEASALTSDDIKNDRYMLEHFPVNTPYGFFINRNSKVTIVSTSSCSEMGIGNFSYYLAKFAGFNYISKDFNVDPDNPESFYNNRWEEPKVDNMTLQERLASGEKVSKKVREVYARKKELRDAFIRDLESLCKGEDHWVFCLLWQKQNQENPVDIHIAHSLNDGKDSLVHDKEKYHVFLEAFTAAMQEQLQLSVEETQRFPLVKKAENGFRNIGYKLRDDGCMCNCMTVRISSHLMHFDSRMRVAQFLIAKTIHDVFTPEGTIPAEDIADMNRSGHGFSDNEIA